MYRRILGPVLLLFYYHRYSALGPVWVETRAQSGDWYRSGTLHPGEVLRERLPGPVYDNEKENWRILTNKDIHASVTKPAVTETVRLKRLHRFGHVQRMEENRIPKRVLYINLGTTTLRGRPRNRWQDGVREDGRMVGGEGWQEKVQNREESKKLLRMARNC